MKPRYPVLLALSLAATAQAAIFERIVAKVNGEIITLSEFENRQLAEVTAANVPHDRVPAYLREHGERILQQTIDEMLVYQKGEEMGIAERVTDDYIDKVVAEIKESNKIESDDVFRSQLAREGLTLEGLRRNIKRSIVRDQVIRMQVASKIVVTEEDLRKEYQRRRTEYTKPETVKLQEIVLKPDTPEARTRATELVRRARGGDDFGALAKEFSVGATKAAGGDLGHVTQAELHPELRKAIAGAAVGHVADPIVLAGTVRVVKVNERQEARTIPFEEARTELADRVKSERRPAELSKFVEQLRGDSEIHRMVREAPVTTDVTVPTEPSLLRDPSLSAPPPGLPGAPPSGSTNPAVGVDEMVVSPQDKPTKVAPPGGPTPTPQPGATSPR
jgi:parvulin-like peptidyl-prolyl isomerase